MHTNQHLGPAMGHTTLELDAVDRWFRAANYLTVGQIYLQDNPLLREPLTAAHIKPRLLGHWGTSPGINFIWAHLNRLIRARHAESLVLVGPGHGGPAANANAWLEGTWSETYPAISRDAKGLRAFFRAFSTPGGVPSHVSPPTPGSIHEGGELGYVLSHAFGAASDNPNLLVAAIVGDGEAETAPLEGSWKGVSFLNAARDGAVLPILHLNGYKIASPTVLARKSDHELLQLFAGHGYDAQVISGHDPMLMHAAFATALEAAHDRIREIQQEARAEGPKAVRWPLLILRTPKGWTGPHTVDGLPTEGSWRSHQVPLSGVRENPEHLAILQRWLASYRPEELFDEVGAPAASLLASCPRGPQRLSASPHANGGALLKPLRLPDHEEYGVELPAPGIEVRESTRQLGVYLRDVMQSNATSFRLFSPDELTSNRLGNVLDATSRTWMERRTAQDDHLAPDGRVLEVLSEHLCEGWLEGYLLTGRHGMFATYEAFAMVVASMVGQHAKWLEAARDCAWRAPIASLNVLLTSTCWRNDHNGFSHQGPGFIDTIVSKRGEVARVYLPPDENCLLSVANHCLKSRGYVNAIVIDKQPQLQWLDMETAQTHCALGASRWAFASNDQGDPDVVMACAGDSATLETMAAVDFLRKHAPELKVRVVNVVDLFRIASPSEHPHGMDEATFASLFTRDRDVVFAFHGYPSVVHALLHGRPWPARFHVRGYRERGSTTTPFDMVVQNETSRFHLVKQALKHAHHPPAHTAELVHRCDQELALHRDYVREHFEDRPEIRGWRWTP
ncbi:MAG: phosphoketolase family protein [Deltaproteobacteria bacterium]|nr:phosphoketolase family protein [Deltaproteobacteria bacterium]